jgi:hypothetical protein
MMIEIKPQKVSRRVWVSEFIQCISIAGKNIVIKSAVSDITAIKIKIPAV